MPFAQRGISYYVSCPSKPTLILINTAKYQIANGFDDIALELNNTLINDYNNTSLGPNKRNNSNFEILLAKDLDKPNSANVKKGLNALIITNNILQNLEMLGQCGFAMGVIGYTEEHFCYKNIDYEFVNLIYLNIGILGLIMVSVGINRLVAMSSTTYFQKMVYLH